MDEVSQRSENNLLVWFSNSDGFSSAPGRIKKSGGLSGHNSDRFHVLKPTGYRVDRKTELDELLAAFGRFLQQNHPNPERIGCPADAALAALANNPSAQDAESILTHVRECAPCLEELKALRKG